MRVFQHDELKFCFFRVRAGLRNLLSSGNELRRKKR